MLTFTSKPFRKTIILTMAVLAVASTTNADIPGYNKAMESRDYITAAVEAEEAWNTLDKTIPETAIIAREFGFTAFMAGDFEQAKTYSKFLIDQGATLPTPDDQPEVSRVLDAMISLKLKPSKATRNDLYIALAMRGSPTLIDNISVVASKHLYNYDFSIHDWEGAEQSASTSRTLMSNSAESYPLEYIETKLVEAAASHLAKPSVEALEKMIEVNSEIAEKLNPQAKASHLPYLKIRYFDSLAWSAAQLGYLKSMAERPGSIHNYGRYSQDQIEEIENRERNYPTIPLFANTTVETAHESVVKLCDYQLKTKNGLYPMSQSYKGQVAGVVLRAEFDKDGRVVDAEVLASVPEKGFGSHIIKRKDKLRREARPDQDLSECTLAQKDALVTITFAIR